MSLITSHNFETCPGQPEPRTSGWFAIVCYLPDPQKSMLDSLRRLIPGRPLPPAHITILPPRPLRFGAERACSHVQGVATELVAFEAELSEVRLFSETEFLYLDIAGGNARLHEIHRSLNAGELRYPEVYEFRPHLTLGGPIPSMLLEATHQRAVQAWRDSGCPRRVLIEELVCLWLAADSETKEWERFGSFSLPVNQSKSNLAGT